LQGREAEHLREVLYCEHVNVFFFSSRRRHTRSLRDWSSDVCSSDLPRRAPARKRDVHGGRAVAGGGLPRLELRTEATDGSFDLRSEERRVGKEWRLRWWAGP